MRLFNLNQQIKLRLLGTLERKENSGELLKGGVGSLKNWPYPKAMIRDISTSNERQFSNNTGVHKLMRMTVEEERYLKGSHETIKATANRKR